MDYKDEPQRQTTLRCSLRGARRIIARSAFMRRTDGNITTLAGLCLPLLMMGAAVAVDGTRMVMAEADFQRAVDAAALAVGTTYADDKTLDTLAERFVEENYNFSGAEVKDVDVVSTADAVVVKADMAIEMYFARIFGDPKPTVRVQAQVQRAGGGLMVALVLDNTGSMWGKLDSTTRIEALRSASITLTDSIFGDEAQEDYLRVGVVPYAAMVNVGDIAPDIVNTHSTANFRIKEETTIASMQSGIPSGQLPVLEYDPSDTTQWKGCVLERPHKDSLADTPQKTKKWEPLIWPIADDNIYYAVEDGKDYVVDGARLDTGGDRSSNGFNGPNVGCPTPILPLTDTKQDVLDSLNAMTAWNRGGTLSDIGMAWGRRVLSKGEPFTEAATELDPLTGTPIGDSTRWRRAIVLMTDGDNLVYNAGETKPYVFKGDEKSDLTGYGRLGDSFFRKHLDTDNADAAKTKVETRLQTICTELKADGVTIYTVVFSKSANSSTKTIYQNCASDPGKYWYAPSADALTNAFGAIGADLNRLRITG